MKYAIIRVKGKQYKVSEGDEILVGNLNGEKVSPEVLLVKTDKALKVGTPTVDKAKVDVKVLVEEEKGKKITVSKYKSKSRYRRKYGFRPVYSKIEISKIS